MTSSRESDSRGKETEREWQTFAGTDVIVHLPVESSAVERAQEELHKAERLAAALKKILTPPEEEMGAPVRLYLLESMPLLPRDASDAGDGAHPRREGEQDNQAVFRLIHPDEAEEPLAIALSRGLISRWFGANASRATLFVAGIAGMAANHLGEAPAVEEADQWVQAELEAGRSVSILARKKTAKAAPAAPSVAAFDPAKTSFLAFLIARFGREALRQYLSAYDPERQDQAAILAYHQPLAVLEEEWLAKRKRHPSDKDTLRSFLRHILPLLKPYKWKQVEILIYLLLAAAFNIVQPYSIKIVIDRLTAQIGHSSGAVSPSAIFVKTLVPFLFLLMGIYLLNGLVSLRRAYTVNWLNQNVLNSLQVRMYAHLQGLAHNFYTRAKIGDIMARLNDDLDTVQSALSQVTNKALYQSFTVVGALTALFMLSRKSPELAIPIVFIIPLFAANYMALRTRNKQASREQRQRVGQAMTTVQENLSAHAVIKAFGMEEQTLSEYKSRVQSLQKSKLRLALLSALTDLSEDMTTSLAQLIIFGVGGYLVLRDHNQGLGVGDLSALLVLVKSIFSPIASLSGIGQTMQQATGAIERVEELFEEPITIADKPDAVPLSPLTRSIELQNVTFNYGGNRPILRNLTLSIPAGAHVAVVGLSGSGKSTMVNLLLRFWDPEKGTLCFDDHDLRDVTLDSLRSQIGLVFQETFIFDTTLRANIAIGRPEATDAEIAAAAKAAQLDAFIETLPAGYNTIPGERGARLSVGQKQRIAIARAFLRNAPILILDEATSALDARTEAGILETLSELAKGRTTISITHRISQAAAADLIFVMDSGRLVEQGTHEALLQAGGLYQRLYEDATDFVTGGVHPQPVLTA